MTTMGPPASVIVPVTANAMVSAPGARFASATACRNDPEPESFVFVTWNVAAPAGIAKKARVAITATAAIVAVSWIRMRVIAPTPSVSSKAVAETSLREDLQRH